MIRSRRIKIYTEVKALVEIKNHFADNCDDTDLKNMIGVKLKEVMQLKLFTMDCINAPSLLMPKRPKKPLRHICMKHMELVAFHVCSENLPHQIITHYPSTALSNMI